MKKVFSLILLGLCSTLLIAQNNNGKAAEAMHKKDSAIMAQRNIATIAAMRKRDSIASATHKKDSIAVAKKKAGASVPSRNPKEAAAIEQHKRDSAIASKKEGTHLPPRNPTPTPPENTNFHPVHASSAVVTGGGTQKSAEGTNQIVYIDNHGTQSVGIAMLPVGAQGECNAQWEQTNNQGVPNDGGHLYGSFGYLGDNGSNYQTQIVAVPSNDPAVGYVLHFQSRKFGEGEYHEGHVIILDWQKNPWLVHLSYSPSNGIVFTYTPYRKE